MRARDNARRDKYDVVYEDSRHYSSHEYTFPVTSVRKQISDPHIIYKFEPTSERRQKVNPIQQVSDCSPQESLKLDQDILNMSKSYEVDGADVMDPEHKVRVRNAI